MKEICPFNFFRTREIKKKKEKRKKGEDLLLSTFSALAAAFADIPYKSSLTES